ncbi:MAG: phosphoribosylanthranilate isomerase [Solirubrobacterales bacterium]
MSTKVKICGVTRLEDAELAAAGGAWAIGVVMWDGSPRRCPPDDAAEIAQALRRRVEVAGVFVNAALDELVATADAIPLTMLQLHGDEGPAYCAEAARATGLKIIKATQVRNAASVRDLATFKTDFHLLDAHAEHAPGGTGERFDWSLAAGHPSRPPVILAGGLRADNVAEGISAVRPFAVDTASGTESSPGIKDPDLMKAFFESVHDAAVSA